MLGNLGQKTALAHMPRVNRDLTAGALWAHTEKHTRTHKHAHAQTHTQREREREGEREREREKWERCALSLSLCVFRRR